MTQQAEDNTSNQPMNDDDFWASILGNEY